MREIKKVVIQNVHSELVLTAKQRSNIQSESPEAIQVTQDLYEEGHSGERLMESLLDLQLPSDLLIFDTGQVFSLIEDNDGSVIFKLGDESCLTVSDGKLIVQKEKTDKESLLLAANWYSED